jgi:hypothetical protein
MKLYKKEYNLIEQYMTIDPTVKSVGLRFIRAFFAGFFSVIVTSATFSYSVSDWHSLSTWLSTLALAGVVGGLSGLFMSIDKYLRTDTTNTTTTTL